MRGGFTVLGGVIAVASCLVLWPIWEPDQVRQELRRALKAQAGLAEAVLRAPPARAARPRSRRRAARPASPSTIWRRRSPAPCSSPGPAATRRWNPPWWPTRPCAGSAPGSSSCGTPLRRPPPRPSPGGPGSPRPWRPWARTGPCPSGRRWIAGNRSCVSSARSIFWWEPCALERSGLGRRPSARCRVRQTAPPASPSLTPEGPPVRCPDHRRLSGPAEPAGPFARQNRGRALAGPPACGPL